MKVYIKENKAYSLSEIEQRIREIFKEADLKKKLLDKKIILLKPNLLGAFPPEKMVTTHPVFVEAVVKILKDWNKEIWIGDSPGGIVSLKKVYRETGIKDIAKKYKVKLVNFNKDGIVRKKIEDFEYFITKNIEKADAIINLPKCKTHGLMKYTGAVKNLYGIVPGLKKSDYHKEFPKPQNFAKVLLDLYNFTKDKIAFNIMDAVVGMQGQGPSSGYPYKFGLIYASEKASAIDYFASKIMGFNPDEIPLLEETLRSDNLNSGDLEVQEKWKDFRYSDVDLGKLDFNNRLLNKLPRFVQNFFKNQFNYRPDFNDKCIKCMICVKGCPVEAITLPKGEEHPEIDYKKCINCLCCHEFCPEDAIYIRKSWLAKLIFS